MLDISSRLGITIAPTDEFGRRPSLPTLQESSEEATRGGGTARLVSLRDGGP